MKRRVEQVAFSFPTVDLLDCIERISDVTVMLIEDHIMIYSYLHSLCKYMYNAFCILWYNHTFPNTILIAIRGLPEKHFVEAFVTQLLSERLSNWRLGSKTWGFSTFSLGWPPNVPNPGPWPLTDPADGPRLSPLGSVKAARETDGRDESVRDESVQFVQFGTKQLDFECLQQLETWSGGSLVWTTKGKKTDGLKRGYI